MINDRSIFTYDPIKGTHTEMNPDETVNSGLTSDVEFFFNYEVRNYHFLYFRLKNFQKKKKPS